MANALWHLMEQSIGEKPSSSLPSPLPVAQLDLTTISERMTARYIRHFPHAMKNTKWDGLHRPMSVASAIRRVELRADVTNVP
jgi:hypothetical protein